jgi:hypothetical protein
LPHRGGGVARNTAPVVYPDARQARKIAQPPRLSTFCRRRIDHHLLFSGRDDRWRRLESGDISVPSNWDIAGGTRPRPIDLPFDFDGSPLGILIADNGLAQGAALATDLNPPSAGFQLAVRSHFHVQKECNEMSKRGEKVAG